MSERAKELAARFTSFNDEMISFVETCSDENWKKICEGENWTIGLVARHVAGGHYGLIAMVKNLVNGKELPEIGMEAIDQMNAQHAKEHADCTKDEVLGMLQKFGASNAEYIGGLSDEDLARTAHFSLAGGDVNAETLIKIMMNGGKEHLTNARSVTGA